MVFACILLYFFVEKDSSNMLFRAGASVCDSENLLSIGESYPEWKRVRIVVRKSLMNGVSRAWMV